MWFSSAFGFFGLVSLEPESRLVYFSDRTRSHLPSFFYRPAGECALLAGLTFLFAAFPRRAPPSGLRERESDRLRGGWLYLLIC